MVHRKIQRSLLQGTGRQKTGNHKTQVLHPPRLTALPHLRKETEMTYIDETIHQLEAYLHRLLDRAEETTYPIELKNRYGETIKTVYIIPSGIEREIVHTQYEIQLWEETKQQDKQR